MKTPLQFDPKSHQITGPAGTLPVAANDVLARHFMMLLEGECLPTTDVTTVAQKYGYSRQRYYQLRDAFKTGGLAALQPRKTGPKSNYRRTDAVVRQVLRYRFLDPDASPEVVTQKLRQTGWHISQRSVQRILADYGLQKKTLRPEPQKGTRPGTHASDPKGRPPGAGRRPQRRARRAPALGR
jgi:transposase